VFVKKQILSQTGKVLLCFYVFLLQQLYAYYVYSYNNYCPGDRSLALQSQNKARYCAAASSAAISPSSTSFMLPALPTLTMQSTAATAVTPVAMPSAVFNLPAPSGAKTNNGKWNPAYIIFFLISSVLLFL
jgi:hypothetical protein